MVDEYEFMHLRARVGELEDQVAILYKHLGLEPPSQSNQAGVDPRIVDLIRRRQMIEAIKLHRELYNTGLAEAKHACDAIKLRLGL